MTTVSPLTPAASADASSLLKVGELAERTGKTNRALRFYEELGLLRPNRRTKGGFRLYDASAVVRIHWIDRLQELGFSLSEIRDFMSALVAEESGPAAMDQLREFYAAKLVETQEAVARLQTLATELSESLDYLNSCRACAPATPRSACPTCNTTAHVGTEAPPLVAAVHGAPIGREKSHV